MRYSVHPISSFKRRFHALSRQRKGALAAILCITVLCAVFLYCAEFEVTVRDKAQLESAIDDYFFTEQVDAHILARQQVGSRLVLLFERRGQPGIHGTAWLERGLCGRHRFLKADLSNSPLYGYDCLTVHGKSYLILWGTETLPGVASFALYPWWAEPADRSAVQPLYTGPARQAPFLQILPVDDPADYEGFDNIVYYDAEGCPVAQQLLLEQLPLSEGRCPSVGSAETGLIYVLIGEVLLLGAGAAWLVLRG